jgi:hypothetical protein
MPAITGKHTEKPYLDEQSMVRFLLERLDANGIVNSTVPGILRLKPDYRSETYKMIVEFDGPEHYQVARKVIEDKIREKAFSDAGYHVIRIPYFVQMTEPCITELFGEKIARRDAFKDFPHGFISTRSYPADFCELGVERFLNDLDRFSAIRGDILESLARANDRVGDWRIIYPPSAVSRLSWMRTVPE